jgi:hypothetical protein
MAGILLVRGGKIHDEVRRVLGRRVPYARAARVSLRPRKYVSHSGAGFVDAGDRGASNRAHSARIAALTAGDSGD